MIYPIYPCELPGPFSIINPNQIPQKKIILSHPTHIGTVRHLEARPHPSGTEIERVCISPPRI